MEAPALGFWPDWPLGSFIGWDETLNAGDAIVAVGTLALAGVTFWLAWQTRREVGLTTSSIELTREGIEAQDMPYVIATPNPRVPGPDAAWMPWSGSGNRWQLSLRLWNIGKGPAIVQDVQLDLDHEYLLPMRGQVPIAAGQAADVTLQGNWQPPGGDQAGLLRIYYRHSSGRVYMTRERVRMRPEGILAVDYERSPTDAEERTVSA